MKWAALPLGVVLLVATFLDVFRTLVMPRAAEGRFRLTRLLFMVTWRPWRWVAIRMWPARSQERFLAGAAPFFLFVLLAVWAALAVLGYALVVWSEPFDQGLGGPGAGSFATALYFSGTSLFTIGFGDVVATGPTRMVAIVEGATGLGLVAVVIAYLPVLYAAFNRREVGVLLLDARAGSPPSGAELLRRAGGEGFEEDLPRLFDEWERWAADLLETHLSYPLLAFFRSPHDNTSWVTALGAVLDGATIALAAVDGPRIRPAELLHATGNHAVEDLFFYFGLEERAFGIEPAELDEVLEDLRGAGIPLRDRDEAWRRFVELRTTYGGRLDALALLVAARPAPWIGDRSTLPAPEVSVARH